MVLPSLPTVPTCTVAVLTASLSRARIRPVNGKCLQFVGFASFHIKIVLCHSLVLSPHVTVTKALRRVST